MNELLKQAAAHRAVACLRDGMVVGVGTGSTVRYFIEALGTSSIRILGAVASSVASESLLRAQGIEIFSLNEVPSLPIYVDGADAIDANFVMIKGGGAALTREKVIASAAEQFICIIDPTKRVEGFDGLPLPVEVIPMSREFVIREIQKLGGKAIWRSDTITDNGNLILDVYDLSFENPCALESSLDQIAGVVECGLFAFRRADTLIIGRDGDPEVITLNDRNG